VSDLAQKVQRLPTQSGVYLFKDSDGTVLYVGKANHLKARVSQYLTGKDGRFMIRFLLSAATDVDVVITHTEKEALILENTLIKQYTPRYNTQLRDDKNFLHIQLDDATGWPRFRLVRRLGRKSPIFGPYHSAKKARATLDFLHRAFPLRTCSDAVMKNRQRPCLLHQLDRCVAPCVEGHTTPEQYQALVSDGLALLEGRMKEVVGSLHRRMHEAAAEESFEQAARFRDLAAQIQATLEEQKVVDKRGTDRDVWAWIREGERGLVCVLPVRRGRMLEPDYFRFSTRLESDSERISSWLNRWYGTGGEIPAEVLLASLPDRPDPLEEVLSERAGRRVRLSRPQRGEKLRLLDLAQRNVSDRFRRTTDDDERAAAALERLATLAQLPGVPTRIECFDNSHFQGRHPVASQVVFVDGKPAKKEYRNYHIKSAPGNDDCAGMREVLGRRLRRAWKEDRFPDLLVVDGGRGQLNAALEVLEDLGLERLGVLGLAKPKVEKKQGRLPIDKILLPFSPDPVRLEDHDPALNLLRHLRDESHRVAVQFHRRTRSKSTLTSELDAIEGVGPARRKALLRHFGSLKALKQADEEAICGVGGVGPQLALAIVRGLKKT
jgi:excinuclease ABC subunit C